VITTDIEETRTYLAGANASACYTVKATHYCTQCDKEFEDTIENRPHKLGMPEVNAKNGTYTYECLDKSCGYEVTINSPAGVNYFSTSGLIVNNWGTSDFESKGGSCSGASDDHQGTRAILGNIMQDENGMYTRYGVYHTASVFLANGSIPAADHDEYGKATDLINEGQGVGKFAVIRFRTYNLNQGVRLRIITDTSPTTSSPHGYGYFWRPVASIPEGEFVTYVIDISKCVDASATKIQVLFGSDEAADAGATIDLAYFAICDNWTEVQGVVGTNSEVCFTKWNISANDVTYTPEQISAMVSAEAEQ
jgi:hypothetical protein